MEALGKNTAKKGKACQNGRLFSLISLVVPRHLPGGDRDRTGQQLLRSAQISLRPIEGQQRI